MENETGTKIPKTKNGMDLYTIMKDKNGFENKICNFDNPDVVAQEGIIIIEAIGRVQIKTPKTTFKRQVDRNTGIIYGIPTGEFDERTGIIKYQPILLGDMLQFDLSNVQERKIWCVVKMHECVIGSPFKRGKPKYRVVDEEKEANRTILVAKSKVRAAAIIDKLTGAETYDMSINLGMSVEHNSPAMLQANLINKAEKEPERFLEIYDNTNKGVITAFKRGLATGLITKTVESGYLWQNSLPLGNNESMVIKYLLEHMTLLQQIDRESKSSNTFFKKHADKSEMEAIEIETSKAAEAPEDKGYIMDADLAAQIKRMNAKEKAMDEKMARFDAMSKQMEEVKGVQVEEAVKEAEPKKVNIAQLNIADLQKYALGIGFAQAEQTTDRTLLLAKIKDIRTKAKATS
jgi:hypothetical protein